MITHYIGHRVGSAKIILKNKGGDKVQSFHISKLVLSLLICSTD